jgi:hypothetical protein
MRKKLPNKKRDIPGWYIWAEWQIAWNRKYRQAGFNSGQAFLLKIIEDILIGNIRYENKELAPIQGRSKYEAFDD